MERFKISDGAEYVLKRLKNNNKQGYIVGGSVRDFLMGKEPSDFDITTDATPDEMEEIFSDRHLITLGRNYGTIGIVYNKELVETTTFRSEGKYSDGRHPDPSDISFSKTIEEDLSRRDFTINAMAMDLDNNIIDIFGGREDLKNGIIKTVGDPYKRFEEDKLRMLRAIRFANRFNFKIEKDTMDAIKKNAPKIHMVSAERVRDEINKMLLSDTPSNALNLLLESNLLAEIFPELMPTVGYDQMSPYHHKDLFKHILCVVDRVEPKLYLRLAALFHDIAKIDTLTIDENGVGHFFGHDKLGAKKARARLKILKYDNETIKKVEILIDRHMKADPGMGKKGIKRLISRVGEDLIFDLYNLMISDMLCTRDDRDATYLYERVEETKKILENNQPVDRTGLAIKGGDLIDAGYKEGQEIGEILDYLVELVIDEKIENERDILLDFAYKNWRKNE